MNKIYSVVIIGGGVGGLNAARFLDNSLLIEQKDEIGSGPIRTGEGISYRALKMQDIEPRPEWISTEINKIERITPNGKVIGKRNSGPYAYIIDRNAFEKYLASLAKAEIITNERVVALDRKEDFWEVKTDKDKVYRSSYLIGAAGINSLVREKISGEKVNHIPGVQHLVKFEKGIDTSVATIFLDNKRYHQGYAWLFPKSETSANVGVCGNDNNINEIFKIFLEKDIREKYGDFELLDNRSGSIPVDGICKVISKDNAFLVGDAAGLLDPIFKGGMSQAMLSGRIAAECCTESLADQYEEKVRSLPLADPRMVGASHDFYSLDNQTLNELGEVLSGKGFSIVLSLDGFPMSLFTKPNLRKNLPKILKFLYLWKRNKDYLW
jgi:digeranylgeranylglycerophospholipid reductase